MEFIQKFKDYLLSQNLPAGRQGHSISKVTVKNYAADVKHFISWLEEAKQISFDPSLVTLDFIQLFKTEKAKDLSPRSLERHVSSLRKFFQSLKLQGVIAKSPFEQSVDEKRATNEDPYQIKSFKDFLYVYNASNLTIKNYIIDIKQFIRWAEALNSEQGNVEASSGNALAYFTTQMVNEYRDTLLESGTFSPASINRKLSSLRKYLAWADSQNLLEGEKDFQDNLNSIGNIASTSHENLPENNINEYQSESELGAREPEEAQLPVEKEKTYSHFPIIRLIQKISFGSSWLLDAALIAPLTQAVISTHRLLWTLKGKPLFTKNGLTHAAVGTGTTLQSLRSKLVFQPHIANLKKSLFGPEAVSVAHLPWYQQVLHHARYTRPNWYKRYHTLAIAHYFNWAVLIIFCAIIGFSMYSAFVQKPQSESPVAAASPPRILSFQGRLTDTSDVAITTSSNLRFAIYSDQSASGSALLWEEVDTVTPDNNGVFSVLLGKNTTIPQSLFANNTNLYLGITVGQTPELTPRQQLATVAYATNAETLQGLPPITNAGGATSNVVLALDGSGNLTIGGTAAPVFTASGGNFTLSGQTLTLTTVAGSNTNVVISPDGTGIIDAQKPLQNTTLNGNIPSALGAVEVDDIFAVLATSSGQSAVTINQDGSGPIISASTGGAERFTVSNAGTITAPAYANAGGVIYTDAAGLFLQTTSGTNTQCLIGGATPSWASCSSAAGANFWTLDSANGALYPINSTLDVFFGGTSSSSANFTFINNAPGSGTPTASISGNLTLNSAGVIQTTKAQTLTIGGDSTGNIVLTPLNGSGNVTITGLVTGVVHSTNGVLSSSPVLLGSEVSGTLPIANGGTGGTAVPTAGAVAYGTGTAYAFTAVGTTGDCLVSNGSGTPTWTSCSAAAAGTNFWTLDSANGVLYPINTTLDVLFGGTSSSSANFAFINDAPGSGVPTASVSGNLTLNSAGVIQTTKNQPLTIGGNTTGAIVFGSNVASNIIPAATDTYNLGSSTLEWNNLYVKNIISGGTVAGFWQRLLGVLSPANITDDLAVGGTSTSTAKFQVFGNTGNATTTGNLTFNGNGTIQTTNNLPLTLGGNSTGNIILSPNNGTGQVTISSLGTGVVHSSNIGVLSSSPVLLGSEVSGTLPIANGGTGGTAVPTAGGIAYGTGTAYAFSAVGSSGDCLVSNGSGTPTWTSCSAAAAGTNFWTLNGGAGILYPINTTLDVLFGGTSSSSANFAFINDAPGSGVPTASVSGNLTLNSAGVIQTTKDQTLTIGGNSTGNIILSPLNGSGSVTVNGTSLDTTASTFNLLNTTVSQINFGGSATTINIGNNLLTTNIAIGGTSGTTTVNNALNVNGVFTATNDVVLGGSSSNTIIANGTFSSDLIPTLTDTYNLGTPGAEWNNLYVRNIVANGTVAGFWQRLLGVLSPANITDDLAIGGSATSSAKFQIFGNTGNATTAGTLTFRGTGSQIQTVNNQTLTIGGDTTGNIVLKPLNGSGTVTISGLSTGVVHSTGGVLSSSPVVLTSEVSGILPIANGGTNSTAVPTAGGIAYGTGTAYAFSLAGSTGDCLTGNGTGAPIWQSCSAAAGSTNFWALSNGALYPINTTLDVLFGGTSSGSANFAFINNAPGSGTPTASISGNLTLNSAGVIQTTKNQPLTIGGNTTGNITLSPLNGNGSVTVNGTSLDTTASTFNLLNTTATTINFGSAATTLNIGSNLLTTNIAIGGSTGTTTVNNDLAVNGLFTANSDVVLGATSANTITANGTFNSNLIPTLTDTYDIGSPSSEWNNLYVRNIISGGTIAGFWQRLLGVLSPANITDDLAIGGSSTSTAKFQVFGNTGNATTTGNLTFNGNGTIQTTNNLPLTFGGNTTGGIVFGSNIASNLLPQTTNTYNLGSPTLQWNNVYAANLILPTTGGIGGYWQLNAGALSPTNITNDVLIGGTSTNSAKFQIFANTGNATTTGNLTFNGNGTIQTTNNQPLTFGGNSTGGIVFASNIASSLLPQTTNTYDLGSNSLRWRNLFLSGDSTIAGNETVTGTITAGNLILASTAQYGGFWQRNAGVLSPYNITDDLAIGGTATSTAKFQIFANTGNATTAGNLTFNGNGTIQTTNNQPLTLGGDTTGGIILDPNNGTGKVTINGLATGVVHSTSGVLSSSNVLLGSEVTGTLPIANGGTNGSAVPTAGGVAYGTGTAYAFTLPGTTGNCLISNGSGTPTWSSCSSAAGASNFWTLDSANGVLYPINTTLDVLFGGTSSGSANFAFINDAPGSGVPTASISGNLTLNSAGVIQTTKNQTLTIGGNSTGNITLSPLNGSGSVTVNGTSLDTTASTFNLLNTTATTINFGTDATTINIANNVANTTNIAIGGSAGTTTVNNDLSVNGLFTANSDVVLGATAANTIDAKGTFISSLIPNITDNYDIGSPSAEWNNVYAKNLFVSGTTAGFWQRLLGVLSPSNITDDLAIGGTSTSTAKFQIFANTGNATTTGNLTFNGNGVIQTTNDQPLTFGGNTTGGIVFGSHVASNILPQTTNTYDLGSASLQWNNIYGNNIFSNGQLLTNLWQENLGVLSPKNITDDLAIGGTSTSTAKFQIFANTGNATTTGNLTFNGNGVIQTTNNQPLTLGGNTTGSVVFASNIGSNLVPTTTNTYDLGTTSLRWRNLFLSGDSTIAGNETVTGTITAGNLLLASTAQYGGFWQRNSGVLSPYNITDDLAIGGTSTSTAKFQIFANTGNATTAGNLTFNGNGTIQTTNNLPLTFGGNSTGGIVFGSHVASNILPQTTNTYDLGSLALQWNNIYGKNIFSNGQLVTQYWQRLLGVLSPANITDDLAIGGTSTSTAKFQIFGDTGNATTAGNLTFNGNGTIQTTNNQPLTFGGNTTGSVVFASNIGSSLVPTTTNTFDLGTNSLRWRNLFLSGDSTIAGNETVTGTLTAGNLILASTAQFGGFWQRNAGVLSPYNITDDLAIGGTATSTAKFQIFANTGNATTTGNLTFNGNGVIQATNNQPLTLGGNSTGSIVFGSNVASNILPRTTNTYDLGSASLQWNNIYGNNIFQNGQPLVQYWQENLGVLSPRNITDDLAIGGTSTSTAKFQIFGLTGNATTAGNLTFNGNGTIQTTNNLPLTFGGNSTGGIVFGSHVASNILPQTTNTYDLGSTALQWNNIYANNVFSNGQLVSNSWQENLGVLSPKNITDDVAVGGTATSTAKFQIFGLTGNATTTGTLTFNSGAAATNLIAARNNAGLTIGDSQTGNIIFNGGNVGIGTTNPLAKLQVAGGNFLLDNNKEIDFLDTDNTTIRTVLSVNSSGNTFLRSANSAGRFDLRIQNNTTFLSMDATGKIGIGAGNTSPLASLDVRGFSGTIPSATISAKSSYAALVVNNDGVGDVLAASSSSIPVFSIRANGQLVANQYANAGGVFYTNASGVFQQASNASANTVLHGGATPTFSAVDLASADVTGLLSVNKGGLGADVTAAGAGEILYSTSATAYGHLAAAVTTGLCLTSNGAAAPSWSSCSSGSSNFWTLNQGALFPVNSTLDLLVGGTATTSAKFAVLNMTGSGTPTASVSSGLNGTGMFMTADGSLQTTSDQTLTIGGTSTGNIILKPLNGTNGTITFSGYGTGIIHSNASGLLTSSKVDLSNTTTDVTGTLGVGSGGTGQTSFNNGALIYGAGTTTALNSLAIGSTDTVLTSSGTAPQWSTSLNLAGGITVAGTSTLNGNVVLGVDNTKTLTVNALLNTSLIPSSSSVNLGDITHYYGTVYANNFISPVGGGTSGFWQLTSNVLSPVNGWNDLAIGGNATSSATPWQVFATTVGVNTAGTATSSGGLSFRGTTTNVNLLNGSVLKVNTSVGGDSGLTTQLTLSNNGDLTLNGSNIITTQATVNLFNTTATAVNICGAAGCGATIGNITGSSTIHGNLTLSDTSHTIAVNGTFTTDLVPNVTNINSLGTNLLRWKNLFLSGDSTIAGNENVTGTVTAGNLILASTAQFGGFWQRNSGVLSPYNITDDLAIGGTATTGAKFQIFGLTGNATTAGSLTFTGATPLIQTTSMLPLTIGSASTGPIQLSPKGTTGLYIDGLGNVGINTTSPTAVLDVAGAASISSTLTFRTGSATIQATANNLLTLGGNTTGAIVFGSNVASNIIPAATDTYNLGSPTLEWNNLYVRQIISPATGGIAGYWQLNSGVLSPTNITNDLAIGGTATSSAAFHVYGTGQNQGTLPVATVSAHTSFAGLVVDNTVGDLFTASSSGLTRFVVAQGGNVGINNSNPQGILDVTSQGSLFPSDLTLGQVAATNWVANPSFENTTALSGWTPTAGSVAQYSASQTATESALFGDTALKFFSMNTGTFSDSSACIPVLSSTNYDVSAYIYRVSGYSGNTSIDWQEFSGTNCTTNVVDGTNVGTTATNAWTRVSETFTTGSTTKSVQVRAVNDGSSVGRAYFDGFQLERGTTATPYLDGSFGPGYSWDTTGTPNATDSSRLSGTAFAYQSLNSAAGIGAASRGTFPTLQLDQDGTGDIMTASVSGVTKFVLTNGGSMGIGTNLPLASTGLDIEKDGLGNSVLAVNQLGLGDIMTASASGVTELQLTSGGVLRTRRFEDYDNTSFFLDPSATGTSASLSGSLTFAEPGGNNSNIDILNGNALNFRTSVGGNGASDANMSTKLTLLNNGNVGIGTTSPANLLTVVSALSGTNPTIETTNDGGIRSFFYTGRSGNAAISGDTVLENNSANAILLNPSGGRVGIGTTGPSTTLDVVGTASISSNLNFYSGNGTTHLINLYTAGNLNIQTSPGGDAGLASALYVQGSTGNIGVGTNAPVGAFDVNGIIYGHNTNNFLDLLTGQGGSGNVELASRGNMALRIDSDNNQTDRLFQILDNASTPLVTVNEAGDVGIGTTAPTVGLQVETSGQYFGGVNSSISLTSGSNIMLKIGENDVLGTNVGGGATLQSGASRPLLLNPGGNNVGVGTASPSALLDVQGTIQANLATANTAAICHSGTNGAVNDSNFTDCSGTPADLAEMYASNNNLEPGDVVIVDDSGTNTLAKTSIAYQNNAVGVVATDPTDIMGNETITKDRYPQPLSLQGRVPVKVSLENGPIHAGDPLTTSSITGVAMKATKAGFIIGTAIENYDGTTRVSPESQFQESHRLSDHQELTAYNSDPSQWPASVGKIAMLTHISWYDPDVYLTDSGDVNVTDTSSPSADFTIPHYYTVSDALGNPISRIGEFAQVVTGSLRAGVVNTQQLFTNSLAIATDNVTIAGQSLSDYIITVVKNANLFQSGTATSPVASIDQLHTGVISPLGKDDSIALSLGNSRLEVKNGASGSAVASIDNVGNATFSGTLNSKNLAVNADATISGTLHAGRIVANEIDGLNAVVGTLSAQNITNVTNIYFATPSASPTGSQIATGYSTPGSSNSGVLNPSIGYTNLASYSGFLAYVPNLEATTGMFDQGLMSLGSTSLADTTITGQLSIGSQLILADNSVNVLGGTFQIQPLRQGGVSFEGGLLAIDTDGNMTVNGNAVFAKNLAANIISPLANNRDLTLQLGQNSGATGSALATSNLAVQNASGSGIFTVDQLGNLVASGEATISKLNFQFAQPALALSDTEVVATGSAGTTAVKAHQVEITIDNKLVTSRSLIYITPVGQSTITPYLVRQTPGVSFTVGISVQQVNNINFNWLVVN